MLKIRCTNIRQTRHNYSQSTESEKAKFQTPSTSNEARNYVEHNSVENISQDLVHPTKSDTASASLISESEERKEIAETADVPAPTPAPTPAPAPALEIVKEQSHTPGSRKSMRKNLGRPASSYNQSEKLNFGLYILHSRAGSAIANSSHNICKCIVKDLEF